MTEPASLRGLDQAVCAILAARFPGTVWKPERPEQNALAADGKVGMSLARVEQAKTLTGGDVDEWAAGDRVAD